MKRKANILIATFCVVLTFPGGCSNSQRRQDIAMWPRIEPYQTGYLKVSDMHEIYYELCGNSKGKPVFVLHGGPGGECTPSMRQGL